MECEERTKLAQEYFSALDQQQRISAELKLLLASGKPELVTMAEVQADVAVQEAYDAWHAFNEHQSAHQCGA